MRDTARLGGPRKSRFVDDPQGAVAEANRLLNDAMRDRGYPADPNLGLDDLSVEHARVVNDYRMANAIAGKSDTTTEERRQLIISVRKLFAELIEKDPMATADAPNRERSGHRGPRYRTATHPRDRAAARVGFLGLQRRRYVR